MSLILPAISGKIGKTSYYTLVMKAKDLADRVVIPKKDPNWDQKDLEQYFQRNINYPRVKKSVAPYFANNSFRFSNTVIIAIRDFDRNVSFTPLKSGLPQSGLVTFDDNCKLVPIDGQHRVLAIKYAISGKDDEGKAIRFVEGPNLELAEEDVPVILVPFETARARAIFSAVNQHAKRTTVSENILLGEEVTHKITRDITRSVFSERLVKKDAKVLDLDDYRVTTLSSLHSCIKDVFDVLHPDIKYVKSLSYRDVKPLEYAVFLESIEDCWESMTSNNDFYRAALANKKQSSDQAREDLKKEWLVSRAMVQECLFKAFALLVAEGGYFYDAKPDEAAQALNRLPLKTNDIAVWQPFLFNPDGTIGNKNKKFIAEFMAYLTIGDKYPEKEKLAASYAKFRPGEELPTPVG